MHTREVLEFLIISRETRRGRGRWKGSEKRDVRAKHAAAVGSPGNDGPVAGNLVVFLWGGCTGGAIA